MARFSRNRDRPSFAEYTKYLPWLRVDFLYRCAYCERTESYMRGQEQFEIDHFKPRRFTELLNDYGNLYYACRKCNGLKSDIWPSDRAISEGFRFSDPCAEDMYLTHLHETPGGDLEARTNCGRYTNAHIRLDRPALVAWRLARRFVLEEISALERAVQGLASLADAEVDPSRRGQLTEDVGVLLSRIQSDREQFS